MCSRAVGICLAVVSKIGGTKIGHFLVMNNTNSLFVTPNLQLVSSNRMPRGLLPKMGTLKRFCLGFLAGRGRIS